MHKSGLRPGIDHEEDPSCASVGAIITIGATVSFFTGFGTRCELLPFFSVSTALSAPLPWILGHARPGLPGTRTAVVLVAFAAFTAFVSILCRVSH